MLGFMKSLMKEQDLGLKAGEREQEKRSSAMSFNPSVKRSRDVISTDEISQ